MYQKVFQNHNYGSDISAGVPIAPFEIVGPQYDELLKEMYTGVSTICLTLEGV